MRNDSFDLPILFIQGSDTTMPFPFRKICFLQCFSVQVSRMSTRAISAFIGDKGSAVPPVQVATIFLATTRACTDLFIAPLLSRDSHSVSPTSFLALKKFSVSQHGILAPSSSNMPLPRLMLGLSLVALISFSTQARPSTSLSPLEPRNNKFWLHCGNAPTVAAGE